MKKTNAPGYFVNDAGVIINNDELAWMKYKSEREAAQALQRMIDQVSSLTKRIEELERRLDEATSNN